jgi:outer membrane autotransporter protein
MNSSKIGRKAFAILLAGLFCGAGMARAQYTVSGTTAGGGQIILGTGAALGALSGISVPVSFSSIGFDQVTLNIGSGATGSGQDTISFTTSNDTLLNNGTVLGGAGINPEDNGFNAISFISGSSAGFSGESVINDGSVAGGTGIFAIGTGNGGNGGTGIEFNTAGGISGIKVTNSGFAMGGVGGNGLDFYEYSSPFNGGDGGDGIGFNAIGDISSITLVISGSATGGSGGNGGWAYYDYFTDGGNGGAGGVGICFNADDSINGINLTNNGSVTGGAGGVGGTSFRSIGGAGGDGGTAIEFNAGSNTTDISFINHGLAVGGGGGSGGASGSGYVGGSGGDGGNGIEYYSGASITGIKLMNYGSAKGGSGGDGDSGGLGGTGIEFNADAGMSYVVLSNRGFAAGGNGGDGGGAGGAATELNSTGEMSGIDLTNSGLIKGGDAATGAESFYFGRGGAGITLSAGSRIDGFTLNNSGMIFGGKGGESASDYYGPEGGDGGDALNVSVSGTISRLVVNNTGSISGGKGSNAENGFFAIAGTGGAGFDLSCYTINSSIVNNTGSISGGSGGDSTSSSGPGGNAVNISATGIGGINGFTLNNSGTISGGKGGHGVAGGEGGNGGTGIYYDCIGSSVSGFVLNNNGVIGGGNGGASGGNGGDGISFNVGNSSDLTINNYGSITGGGGGVGGKAGIGVQGNQNSLALNNWGVITAGSGFQPAAVRFSGNRNTINLFGHSAVNGLIESTGKDNVLNFAFSGISPSMADALHAQLMPYLNGQPSSGSVTIRGVTYVWDPVIVEWDITDVSSYELQGVTPNQRAVGASLDSATADPVPGSSLFKLFNAIDLSGNVPTALEALSPQKYQIYGDLAIENATAIVQNIDQRLNNICDGSESIDMSGVGAGADPVAEGFGKESDGKQPVRPAPAPEQRWGYFATGDGFFYRGDNHDQDLQEGRSNAGGTLAGVDGKIGDNAVIGALFAYDEADTTLDGDGSHATIDSYAGGLYGAWHPDDFRVNAMAAYTRNNYSSDRNIIFPGFADKAKGSTNGNQYTVNLDGDYDWHATECLTASPLLGLQWVHLGVNGFNESGAGAADLAIGDQSMDSLQSRLGGRVDCHLLTRANLAVATDLHAAWQHEYLDNSRAIRSGFSGTGLTPFSVQTSAPLRDAAVLGGGLNFTFHDRLTLFADYEVQLWNRGYVEQTINGGVRISF